MLGEERMKKTTIKEVAKDAGVSISTASFALNNVKGRVSEKVKNVVLASAEKLGYTPNMMARNLRKRSSYTLALIYEEYFLAERNASTLQFIAMTVRYAKEKGMDVLIKLHDYMDDQKKAFAEYTDLYSSGRVEGLIFFCKIPEPSFLQQMAKVNVNFAVVPHEKKMEGVNKVFINNFAAMMQVVEHIHSKGYQKICYLTLKEEEQNERESGFKAAIQQLGIDGNCLYYHSRYRGKGEIWDSVREEIESSKGRIAFACWNDVDAINLIDILHSQQIRIPEEVGVMGFDDIPSSEYTNPPLTTIQQPFEVMAQTTVDLLIGNMKNDGSINHRSIEIPCRVIERLSL